MPKSSNNGWIKYLALGISIIAIAISIRSCSLSKQSNEIAQNALNHAKKSFISENRPFLILQPVKDKDKGFFIDLQLDKKDAILISSFEIHNAGNTPAINISTKGLRVIGRNLSFSDDLKENIKPVPVISLGPGEKRFLKFHTRFGFKSGDNKRVRDNKIEVVVAENIKFRITLPLSYNSHIDGTKQFKTTVTYEFPNFKEAYLLESIYE
ncbi:MAG: hypothetical protein GY705_19615 [Bacteroidetes bacterium]|nr:hypothetical protein [Bacteroidota bacterium]